MQLVSFRGSVKSTLGFIKESVFNLLLVVEDLMTDFLVSLKSLAFASGVYGWIDRLIDRWKDR